MPANRRSGAFGRIIARRLVRRRRSTSSSLKAGANLRLQKKLDTMDYESQMRSWLTEPVDSDSDDDDDDEEDGARPAGGAAAADE